MKQQFSRLADRLDSGNLAPETAKLHQPFTGVERKLRVDLLAQTLRQRGTFAGGRDGYLQFAAANDGREDRRPRCRECSPRSPQRRQRGSPRLSRFQRRRGTLRRDRRAGTRAAAKPTARTQPTREREAAPPERSPSRSLRPARGPRSWTRRCCRRRRRRRAGPRA